ncbi:MAG TPA: SDR family NAD(P)-dependent oxidoreductase [Chlorobaculum sp.]|nr:SDR family NAD(P)-dependent oxidoreductase [Chlorobaculum sp.]
MKTVVITGSTRGIGLGLARRFLDKGFNVVINGSGQASVERALNDLASCGERVLGVVADVSSRKDVQRLYDEAEKRFRQVDIWVNNAGISQPLQKVWELDEQFVDKIVDINIKGVVHGTAVPFQAMKSRGSGKIFTMEGHGSKGAILDRMTIYGTTKSAVTYFTKSFAHEARGSGITIGCLIPGMVVTDLLFETVRDDTAESRKRKMIYNMLADDVETVSAFLVEGMLAARDGFTRIEWLTRRKAMFRLLFGKFRKRDFFAD